MIYGLTKLYDVHPRLWAAAGLLGYKSKYDWKIVSGKRVSTGMDNPESQEYKYAIGRTVELERTPITDAPPFTSPHEYGLAIDIQPTLDKGASVVQDLTHPAWDEKTAILAAMPEVREITLKEGADKPHIELRDWMNNKEWRLNYAAFAGIAVLLLLIVRK